MGGGTRSFLRCAVLLAALWAGTSVAEAPGAKPFSLAETLALPLHKFSFHKAPKLSGLVSAIEMKGAKPGAAKKVYCLPALHWQPHDRAQFGVGVPTGLKSKAGNAKVMAAFSVQF